MKIELHDMREHPHRIELLEMPAVPRIDEVFAWTPDEAAFRVRQVRHVAGKDVIQVLGW